MLNNLFSPTRVFQTRTRTHTHTHTHTHGHAPIHSGQQLMTHDMGRAHRTGLMKPSALSLWSWAVYIVALEHRKNINIPHCKRMQELIREIHRGACTYTLHHTPYRSGLYYAKHGYKSLHEPEGSTSTQDIQTWSQVCEQTNEAPLMCV